MESAQSFSDLIDRLAGGGVEFVVVGGVAAVIGGAPMTTFDLDVVFEPSAQNLERLLGVLAALDARYADPAGREIRPDAGRLGTQGMHLLRTRLGRLDLFREIGDGMGWAKVRERSHVLELAGHEVRVLDLEAVLESKLAAGRDKDLAAIPLLRETLRLRREKGPDPSPE